MKSHAITLLLLIGLSGCGKKPTADFSWTPGNPMAGEKVQFNNHSTDAKAYDWNLGNMKISSEMNPANVYTVAGEYIIDLTARNKSKSDTKTMTLTIAP